MITVTAIINFHNEELIAIPSLRSFMYTCRKAEISGIKVEKIAILDKCNELTRLTVEKWAKDFTRIEEVRYGDLGESRNHGVRVSKNELIATFDGDDLWGVSI
jgi:hypothetical protein